MTTQADGRGRLDRHPRVVAPTVQPRCQSGEATGSQKEAEDNHDPHPTLPQERLLQCTLRASAVGDRAFRALCTVTLPQLRAGVALEPLAGARRSVLAPQTARRMPTVRHRSKRRAALRRVVAPGPTGRSSRNSAARRGRRRVQVSATVQRP